ncbi:MAG: C69 family dipeptidase [Erysipelotrichaceae bacterium]|nr:C69 family dipeptidase [Erysipelotrichaceae bacterium]
MPCTTVLAGKKATYDGSTFAARNEDSPSGMFGAKKFIVVEPKDQPEIYHSVISHVTIPLPKKAYRYTAMPNADPSEGIWAAAGVNELNVAMTATETITSNERVLSGDPLVVYKAAKDGQDEVIGGIGEEDLVSITLPYIKSARDGVKRLGSLLEKYGTYEMNGIAFQDGDEVWWLETIGGHHWIAKRVPDEAYVVMPNQLGIDDFDLEDAFGEQKEHMCSADLREFISTNHLDLNLDGAFNPRYAFGSHSDSDHVYNTPRAWAIERYFNPRTIDWDSPDPEYTPESNDLPWCLLPERKITVEDIKYVLSNHYQGTKYDPYLRHGDTSESGKYRVIGINRNNFLSLTQIRSDVPKEIAAIEWVCFGSNPFNAFVPFFTQVNSTPEYFANTTTRPTTENFYWANRYLGALADSHYPQCISHIERYQNKVQTTGHALIKKYEKEIVKAKRAEKTSLAEKANQEIADRVKEMTYDTLDKVLATASNLMKNAFSRSDA